LTVTCQFGTQEHPVSILTDHVLEGWNREKERVRERKGKKKKPKPPKTYHNINTYQVLPNTTPSPKLALNRVNYKQEQLDKILISPNPFQGSDNSLCTCPHIRTEL
jgi:hypothetical protein